MSNNIFFKKINKELSSWNATIPPLMINECDKQMKRWKVWFKTYQR
jgi:hypothetical protein